MKIARVARGGAISFAVIEGDEVAELDGPPIGGLRFTGNRAPLADVRLLAPVLPSKVIAVGLNYPSVAESIGMPLPSEPLISLKPSTSVIGPEDPIRKPRDVEILDHEAELAVVVNGLVRNADEETATQAILGYTCANDLTSRDLREREGQWTRAKGYDSFCPLGPWIETDVEPLGLRLRARVNGEVRQDANTKEMVFGPVQLVSFVSRVMTLLPGDVICTGTPAGVGAVEPGDVVEVEIEGIGVLRNPVQAAG
ncbi:MAG: fumarylacetoacetate hydrolase family protein [Actinobacteria bacterium]|nr:MAG: fumarylacetoacetate hydrolase family protein [Actinomycetota bacterium]